MNKKNIVILGANGQVGIEVCFYLKSFSGVSVTAVLRNEYSATILKKLDIKCLFGNLIDDQDIQAAIEESDVVLDLAGYATGSVDEVNDFYDKRLKSVISRMTEDSNYIFASSMNALGFHSRSTKLRYHFFPTTIYSATKRFAENLSIKLGKKHNINTFIFRFGEVHGVIQRSTNEIGKLIDDGYTFVVPDTPSWTIFTYSIAEALIAVGDKLEEPGIYMLVSPYEWSWKELIEYVAREKQCSVKVEVTSPTKINMKYYINFSKRMLYSFASKRRDIIRANFPFLHKFESLMKIKGMTSRVNNEISIINESYKYFGKSVYQGRVPGKRIKSISDIKDTISLHEKSLKIQIEKLAQLSSE